MAIDRRPFFKINFEEDPNTFSGKSEDFYEEGFRGTILSTIRSAIDIGYKRFIIEYPAGSRLEGKRASSQWRALAYLTQNVPSEASSYPVEGSNPNSNSGVNPDGIDYQNDLTQTINGLKVNFPDIEICYRVGFDMSLNVGNDFDMEGSVPLNLLENQPPLLIQENPDNPDAPNVFPTDVTPRAWVLRNWKPLFDLTTPDINGNKRMFVDDVFVGGAGATGSEGFFREVSSWIEGEYGVKLIPTDGNLALDKTLVNRPFFVGSETDPKSVIENPSVEAYADVGLVDSFGSGTVEETWTYCRQIAFISPNPIPVLPDIIRYDIIGVYDSNRVAGRYRPNGTNQFSQPEEYEGLQGYDPDILLGEIPTVASRPVSGLGRTERVVNLGYIPVVDAREARFGANAETIPLGSAVNLLSILNNLYQGKGRHPNDLIPGSIKPFKGFDQSPIFPGQPLRFCEDCDECRGAVNPEFDKLPFNPTDPLVDVEFDPRISDLNLRYAFL